MDTKLIKKDDHYFLEVEPYTLSTLQKHTIIANTFAKPKGDILQLSLKNCQAIESGYDLVELFDKVDNRIDYHEFDFTSFRLGAEAILELMGDNVFNWLEKKGYLSDDKDILKEEYNYQTEWEVEIEMEFNPINHASGLQPTGNKLMDISISQNYKPKLDADGCLILKRK